MFEQTLKNFNINFNALNESNTWSCGDLLTGHLHFDLTKETKINSIILSLTGKADVHWSTGGGGGRKKRNHRKHYRAEVIFFNLKTAVLQENGAVKSGTKLQPGRHQYQFTCQIPQGNFPSSFRGVNGSIVYSMKMGISRPWRMTKDFTTELDFVHHINVDLPELHAPLEGTNSMTLCCLWCTSGPISMTARVEKKVFVRGETVMITCYLSNGSRWTANTKASLVQKQTFFTTGQVHRRLFSSKLASVSGEAIAGHNTMTTMMMLTIPSTAPFTISNCSIIVVEYIIQVNFGVRNSPDASVLFPIIIHDGPVPAQPPSYM